LVALSALTVDDVAPDFCRPKTSVGNKDRASQATSLKTPPLVVADFVRRSVNMDNSCYKDDLEREVTYWQLEVRR
jgi:hypothetical protein